MRFIIKNQKDNTRGFTIVELIIVIVVIAVLAAIVTVAYNGIQRRTTQSMLQNTARDVGKFMETQKVDLGVYPTTISSAISLPSGVGIAITQVENSAEFCINVTTQRYDDVFYSVNQAHAVNPTLCPGAVLATRGDYNAAAGAAVADAWVTDSSVGRAVAPGDMEFTATTNETWSQVTLSWKAVSGATQYRINQRTSSSGTWYSRSPTSSSAFAWDVNGHSGNISSATTSLVWTYNIPTVMSDAYQYRIQYRNADTTWSDWQELTLSPLQGRTTPIIRNFTVTPNANWSSVTLAWDGIGNYAKLPGVKIRINQRDSSTGTWYSRSPTSSSAFAWDVNGHSGTLAPTLTTYALSNGVSIPQTVSSIYEYRIQVYSGTHAGEWTTFSLNPLQNGDLPQVTNFSITPAGNWSSVTMNWDSIGSAANLPGVKLRINQRDSSTGTWYSRGTTSSSAFAWDVNGHSGALSPTLSSYSLTYSTSIPTVGSTYEYRIQPYSGTATGPWTVISLSR